MTSTLKRETTSSAGPAPRAALPRRADLYLAAGTVAVGTLFLGLIGIPLMIYGLLLLRRAERTPGIEIRPWSVTIVGLFCGVDAAANFVGWSIDVFAHDTGLAYGVWAHSFGPIVDGAYYIHYNRLLVGGTGSGGEKILEVMCVCVIFPLRIAATWGFIKMKRWGLHYMIITSWLYIVLWFTYIFNMGLDFENRLGAARYGMIGWILVNMCSLGPFVFLPYLYTVNKAHWVKD